MCATHTDLDEKSSSTQRVSGTGPGRKTEVSTQAVHNEAENSDTFLPLERKKGMILNLKKTQDPLGASYATQKRHKRCHNF